MRDKLLIGAIGYSPIREELVWPLDPPLTEVDEAKPRILALRNEALVAEPSANRIDAAAPTWIVRGAWRAD